MGIEKVLELCISTPCCNVEEPSSLCPILLKVLKNLFWKSIIMSEKMELSRLKNNKYVPCLFPSPVCWLVYLVLQKIDLMIRCNDSFFFFCPEEAEVWFYQQAFPLDRKLVMRLKRHKWIFLSVVVAFWLTMPYLIISKYTGIRSNQEIIHLDTRSNQGWGNTVLIFL